MDPDNDTPPTGPEEHPESRESAHEPRPEPEAPGATRRLWLWRVVRAASIALLGLVLAAIIIQNFTSALPLGLLNAGREQYALFSIVSLVLCALALTALVLEAFLGWPRILAGIIRGVLVFVIVLEGLLWGADVIFADRPDASLLGGPYRELRTESGARLILRKPEENSPFGFRTDAPYALEVESPRVLFLGDSYTQGSGNAAACNYPDVVERVLSDSLHREVEVMNAGVSSYGPEDALELLRELMRMGYAFDALVFNLFIENDFTDNLPGTVRRVVAGMPFRFPESVFLRTFHPFNTRLVRWAMFIRAYLSFQNLADRPAPAGKGPCVLETDSLTAVSPFLQAVVTRGLDAVERAAGSYRAQRSVLDALDAMKSEADELGVPFAVVVFPDRILADGDLQRLLELDPNRLEPSLRLRTLLHDVLGGTHLLDTTDLLSRRSGMYRANDAHLSDAGNVLVGEWVGEQLYRLLGEGDPDRGGAGPASGNRSGPR